MGQAAKIPKSEQVMTLLTTGDREALDKIADIDGISRSELVRDLIRSEIRRRGITVNHHEIPGQQALFEEGIR